MFTLKTEIISLLIWVPNMNQLKRIFNSSQNLIKYTQFISQINQLFIQKSKLSEQVLEQSIQYLELEYHHKLYVTIKPGERVDPGRNFQRQWDILDSHPLIKSKNLPNQDIINYWQQLTERLKRPMLRIFMKAIENDPHTQIAFRPSEEYKQKRLKRNRMSLGEFHIVSRQLLQQNQICLNCTKSILQREIVKKDLIARKKNEWLKQNLQKQQPESQSKEIKFTESHHVKANEPKYPAKNLRGQSQDLVGDQINIPSAFKIEKQDCNYLKFKDCNIDSCQFNVFQGLKPTYITNELMQIMSDQFSILKWKTNQIEWPLNPVILRYNCVGNNQDILVIRPQSIQGFQVSGNTMIIGTDVRTLIIRETIEETNQQQYGKLRDKRKLKEVCISIMDPQQGLLSTENGIKVDYDHFHHHRIQHQDCCQTEIKQMKKACQLEQLQLKRREMQIKSNLILKKRKDDQLKKRKKLLKIRSKLRVSFKNQDPYQKLCDESRYSTVINQNELNIRVNPTRIMIRNFNKENQVMVDYMKLQCIQESPSKFRLTSREESLMTSKFHLGQESQESCSSDIQHNNLITMLASKVPGELINPS